MVRDPSSVFSESTVLFVDLGIYLVNGTQGSHFETKGTQEAQRLGPRFSHMLWSS